ncbi:hypothetical protein MOU_07290 [Xanthomonas citri pv. malvacearum str. GSPB1386]|nr:hypothetical protein WS7_00975 [Xanthomonas citri pv. malvacearum str. GSPB2388]EKQ65074.1 hypothetical protein MOU_07290 [Xanthomonas citri pv. malvacearum str. GSPB1386]
MSWPINPQQPNRAMQHLFVAVNCFSLAVSQLAGAVSSPIVGPLAAWMPPSSPQGRVHGVSRKG